MQIGVYTDSLGGMSQGEMLDVVAREKVTWLELGCGNWSPAPHLDVFELLEHDSERKVFLSRVGDHGLRIGALNCSGNPLAPGEAGAQDQRIVSATFRLAGALGVERVVMMSGCPGGPGDKNPNWVVTDWPPAVRRVLQWQWEAVALPYWQELAALAAREGIREICIELHGAQLVYNVATFLRLRDSVGAVVKCNLDPTHLMWMGGDPVAVVERIGEYVGFVHAKDLEVNKVIAAADTMLETRPEERPADRAWRFVGVGRGHDAAWWKRFLGALRGKGFTGILSIEHEDPGVEAVAGIREARRFLLTALSEPDGLAER